MNRFLWGAAAACAIMIALLFLKFWSQTRDRLFAMFAAAFAALGLNWGILGALDPQNEARSAAYVVRLLAFSLLVAGIVAKNRSVNRRP